MAMNTGQRQLFNLGRFVLAYAQVEGYLRKSLYFHGQISETVSKIVLSGIRSEDAISYLKKLLKASNLDAQILTDYMEVFEHIGPIKEVRNLLLHSGIEVFGLGFVVTNASKMLNPEDATIIPVSHKVFEQMTADLDKMTAMLINNLLRLEAPPSSDFALDRLARGPWLYIPPPQGGQSKQKDRQGQSQGKKR
jgi:hypothetical protein